jgi:hypothetical protein
MEIKFKLDTKKATRATVAIAAAYALCRVSEHINSPQLAAANAIALIVIIAILYGPCPSPTKTNYITMMPDAITLLFKESRDTFPSIEGKLTDNNLQSIHKNLLPILMEVPYNQLGGTHSLVGILTDAKRYTTNHGGATFVRPLRLPLYDMTIADDATTVVRVHAESAHQAKLDNYASFKAAERGVANFLRKVVDEVWYSNLKDANTFYTKVMACEIIAFLNANSGGLHAIDMISLHTNMHNYYTQADGIPQTSTCWRMRKKRQRGLACPSPMMSS